MATGKSFSVGVGAALAACLVGWVFAGCTTALRSVVYRPSTVRARFVEYKVSGYAAQGRYVTDGVRVCYEYSRYRGEFQRGPGFTREYQVQSLPTAEGWRKFWRALDRLQLARWRSSYGQFDVPVGPGGEQIFITDLSAWTLTITTSQGSRTIEGDGAYPVAGHPERVALEHATDARGPLEAALRELVGQPCGAQR